MKRMFFLFLLLVLASTAWARYADDFLAPWVGATQDELVAKWGYPQSANDIVKIDDEITIYTYRSYRDYFRPEQCVVSFTIKNKVVTNWKYEGGSCPRIKR